MPLCLPVRYIPSGMLLVGNSQNLFGIFRETCQVYFLTAPNEHTNEYFAVNLILRHKIKLTARTSVLLVPISAIRG